MKQYFDRNGVRISAGDILHYEYFECCNGAYELVGANVLPVSEMNGDLGILDVRTGEFISLSETDLACARIAKMC